MMLLLTTVYILSLIDVIINLIGHLIHINKWCKNESILNQVVSSLDVMHLMQLEASESHNVSRRDELYVSSQERYEDAREYHEGSEETEEHDEITEV